ncbi:MAG: SRPBCC family protein [Polyangiaceae bacterium]|nr:SRPBCC family protein [Polyangiaceae bacterium]
MHLTRRSLLALGSVAGASLLGRRAEAAPAPVTRYEVETPYSDTKAGAARVVVEAPASLVRKIVTDFRKYPKLTPRFQKVKIVGRDGDRTDVYLRVPILKGTTTIWVVLRFEPPREVDGTFLLEAHMVKGNVKRMDTLWKVRPIDDERCEVSLEMHVLPKIFAPSSVITGEAATASERAVHGTRRRAEKKRRAAKEA